MTDRRIKASPHKRSRSLLTARATRLSEPPPELSHIELRIWLRLLDVSNQIKQRLSARLRQQFKTSMARFDLLAQLERAGDEPLSMSALSGRVMVTNGAITGLVDGLVEDRLVERRTHPRDRRTVLVSLTPAGRRKFLKMAQQHEQWVIELFAGVSPQLKNQVNKHLAVVKRQLQPVKPARRPAVRKSRGRG